MVRRPHGVGASAAETGSLGGEHQVSKQGPVTLQQASDTAVSGTSRSCPHGACILTGRQLGNGINRMELGEKMWYQVGKEDLLSPERSQRDI